MDDDIYLNVHGTQDDIFRYSNKISKLCKRDADGNFDPINIHVTWFIYNTKNKCIYIKICLEDFQKMYICKVNNPYEYLEYSTYNQFKMTFDLNEPLQQLDPFKKFPKIKVWLFACRCLKSKCNCQIYPDLFNYKVENLAVITQEMESTNSIDERYFVLTLKISPDEPEPSTSFEDEPFTSLEDEPFTSLLNTFFTFLIDEKIIKMKFIKDDKKFKIIFVEDDSSTSLQDEQAEFFEDSSSSSDEDDELATSVEDEPKTAPENKTFISKHNPKPSSSLAKEKDELKSFFYESQVYKDLVKQAYKTITTHKSKEQKMDYKDMRGVENELPITYETIAKIKSEWNIEKLNEMSVKLDSILNKILKYEDPIHKLLAFSKMMETYSSL